MTTNTMKCTAPGCAKALRPEEAWLPEMAAMVRANGGQVVGSVDFAKFCLCGKHGHLLRQEGVRVYRFLQTVDFAKRREERAEAERMTWQPFADRFVAKTSRPANQAKPRQPRRPRGPEVGGGLSRLSKMDAEKRRIKEQEAVSADPTPAQGAPKA
jgi:hypothetical protein